MKNLKKLTALLLIAIMLFGTAFPVVALAAENLVTYNPEQPVFTDFNTAVEQPLPFHFDDVITPASLEWQKLVAGEAPAQFSTASYELAPDVVEIDSKSSAAVKTMMQSIVSGAMLADGRVNTNLKIDPNRIIAEGAFIQTELLSQIVGREVRNGEVLVDRGTRSAFKVVGANSNANSTMMKADETLAKMAKQLEGKSKVVQPQISEVLDDFELGGASGESVDLTNGNITGFASGMEDDSSVEIQLSTGGNYGNYSSRSGASAVSLSTATPLAADGFRHLPNKWIGFSFDETPLDGYKADGTGVSLNVKGNVGLAQPTVKARYTAFKGYEFSITVQQECNLTITLFANINEEIYIPLFGLDIPFGIGSVRGGVFLVCGINGDFRLEIIAGEYTSTTLGVGGKTFFMVPTSVRPIFKHTTEVWGDVQLSGQLNAYVKVGPELKITILGIDLLGAGAYLGAGVSVEVFNEGLNLDIRLYGIFNVFITALGKRKNLVDFNPTILRKQQVNMEGYKVFFDECFIAPGRVGGRFMKEDNSIDPPGWKVPEGKIQYRIVVEKEDGSKDYYPSNKDGDQWRWTNGGGEFFIGDGLGNYMGYDYGPFGITGGVANGIKGLKPNDKIRVEFILPGRTAIQKSEEYVTPMNPFGEVTITAADSFNDFVLGYVNQQQLKDWEGTPWQWDTEDRLELQYPPKDTIVYITPMAEYGYTLGTDDPQDVYQRRPYSSTGSAATDALGLFDTREHYSIKFFYGPITNTNPNFRITDHSTQRLSTKIPIHVLAGDGAFFHREEDVDILFWRGSFDIFTKIGEVSASTLQYNYLPQLPSFFFNREIIPVEGSFSKTLLGDGSIVDRMEYDEYIWVVNPAGTRVISDKEFFHAITPPASRVDRDLDSNYRYSNTAQDYDHLWKNAKDNSHKLVRTTDAEGNTTTMFGMRQTLEWIWQPHPNPVKLPGYNYASLLRSGNSYEKDEDYTTKYEVASLPMGATIQITADGLLPVYYLKGDVPPGVSINKYTGLMTVTGGLDFGVYKFTVGAVQEYQGTEIKSSDAWWGGDAIYFPDYEYYGHDPAPASEIDFFLGIRKQPVKILPLDDDHLSIWTYRDDGCVFPVEATGDSLISWRLAFENTDSIFPYTPPERVPTWIRIDPDTGIITVDADAPVGTYNYAVIASNTESFLGPGVSQKGIETYHMGGIDIKQLKVVVDEHPYNQGPATIVVDDPLYTVPQGSDYQIPYRANGALPITVTVSAVNAHGGAVSGFTVDAKPYSAGQVASQVGTLDVPADLAAGTYTVTATAANELGEDSVTFTVEVTSAFEPPVINTSDSTYTVTQGLVFQIPYTLTGSEPVDVSFSATNARGDSAFSHFFLNKLAKTLSVKSTAPVGTYTVTLTAENDAGTDTASFTLSVEPAGTAPVFAEEEHNYEFWVTTWSEPTEIQINVTGTAPITYSLEPYETIVAGPLDVPDSVSIDPDTGLLTVDPGPNEGGTFYFNIKATNSYGSAVQLCRLEVDTIRPRGASNSDLQAQDPLNVTLVSFTGSDPGVTPLSSASASSVTPIAQASRMAAGMTGISNQIGTYEVTSNAADSIGLKAQAAIHLTVLEWQGYMSAAALGDSLTLKLRQDRPVPLNTGYIRWDDKRDVYTKDRDTVNGTEFIFWATAVKIDVTESELNEISDSFWVDWKRENSLWGKPVLPTMHTGAMVKNTVYWYDDLYHAPGRNDVYGKTHEDTSPPNPVVDWDQDKLNAVKDYLTGGYRGSSAASGWDDIGVGGMWDEMNEEGGNPVTNPWAGLDSYRIGAAKQQYLEFGSHLAEMAGLTGGDYTVVLDDYSGSYIPYDYFVALEENKAISLVFEQEEYTLTFHGKDLSPHDVWEPVYNLGYHSGTSMKHQILDAMGMTEEEYLTIDLGAIFDDPMIDLAGLQEGEHYTYSFMYHGDLPGMATFDIKTTIPEGLTVNVYKHDAAADKFILIARNLKVGEGGIVTYRNNTMSHYIITTETIAGAITQSGPLNVWLYVIIIAAVVLLAACVVVVIVIRKKKRGKAPQAV